tara:strand:- start:3272 stop:3493 length:222 start_codon:yes stop_codon:yes gene_type:complete
MDDMTKIFESYVSGKKTINEQIDDPSVANDMVKALQDIASELKTLNQYVDFMSTGTRTGGGSRAAAQPIDRQI